jgi:hypothetical protein
MKTLRKLYRSEETGDSHVIASILDEVRSLHFAIVSSAIGENLFVLQIPWLQLINNGRERHTTP